MGTLVEPPKVKLFVGVLVSDPELLPRVQRDLQAAFGPIDHRTGRLRFDDTDYYRRQMGATIDRVFFSFEDLIEAETLPSIKVRTNGMEQVYREENSQVTRPVNFDPGYLEQPKVVLASTKNFYHRMYLSRGVFAEVTMHFRNNTYQFFPWTYPDYRSSDSQEFFLRVRQIYRAQLKKQCILRTDARRIDPAQEG